MSEEKLRSLASGSSTTCASGSEKKAQDEPGEIGVILPWRYVEEDQDAGRPERTGTVCFVSYIVDVHPNFGFHRKESCPYMLTPPQQEAQWLPPWQQRAKSAI
jgi:hypothetical protein